MTLQQMIGFELAGRIWGTYLTDNVTVNLHVGTASLGANILGGALPGFKTNQDYSDFRTRFNADKTSSDDQAAWESMFPNQYQLQRANVSQPDRVFISAYDVYLDSSLTYGGTQDWFSDIAHGRVAQKDGISYGRWETWVASPTMALTLANAKSVGIDVSTTSSTLDGYIVLSNLTNNPGLSWSYDFTRSSVMPSNTVDFLSTALHEIGHALGFVSGVDRPNLPSPFFKRSDSPDGSLEKLWGTSLHNKGLANK